MKRIGSKKSISAVLPVFVVVALILVILAGYYVATVLPGSLPTNATSTGPTYTSTVTGNLTSANVSYIPIHSKMVNFSSVYIVPGASDASVQAFRPNPATVVIGVNNTIEWRNEDNVAQNIVGANGLFKSGNLTALSGLYSYTFTTPGTYAYSSTLYPFENGTIIVVAGS